MDRNLYVHYSISMKIEFNVDNDASGHYLCGSQSLVPLHMHATSYRLQNTAHFGIIIAAIVILLHQQKLAGKIEIRSGSRAWKVTC